jgi:hypothetical protein
MLIQYRDSYKQHTNEESEENQTSSDNESQDGSRFSNEGSIYGDIDYYDKGGNLITEEDEQSQKPPAKSNTERKYAEYNHISPTKPVENSIHVKHCKYTEEKLATGTLELCQKVDSRLASPIKLLKIMQMTKAPMKYMKVLQK